MIIGVPKEIKNNENRVAATPAGVYELTMAGHSVIVENGAGEGSGIADMEYVKAGAQMAENPKDVYGQADVVYKVKEPIEREYAYLKEGQTLFTYLHLAADAQLTKVLQEKKITAIAYETVQLDDGTLPLLVPMSEVAGRMSVQIGANYLLQYVGGSGVLLGGVPGVSPGNVVIFGAGTVGYNAARMAVGIGAQVTILDVNKAALSRIDDIFNGRVTTLFSNLYNAAEAASKADVLIGAVLIPGAKAPRVVSEDMVKGMKKGSVIVDVAIDQGGCIETADTATTHEEPFYVKHGILHYSVANMPGAVPRTSTYALSSATLPYMMSIANAGPKVAMQMDAALMKGLNVYDGKVTCEGVAEAFGLAYTPAEGLLK